MPRQKSRKRQLKEKLSLTISPDIRRKAEAVARHQRRSISSLFEFCIVLEYEKNQDLLDHIN